MITVTNLVIGVAVALIGANVLSYVGLSRLALLTQYAGVPAIGAAYVYTGGQLLIGVAASLVPFGILALVIAYYYIQGWRALNGSHGDAKRWIAEFARDNDRDFMWAIQNITSSDRKELSIVAESKEEFREKVIERAEEHTQ